MRTWTNLCKVVTIVGYCCSGKLQKSVECSPPILMSVGHEIRSSESSWSNRFMRLKAYQMPKTLHNCFNTHRQDFTTLESYSGNYFMFCHNDLEVNSRNTAFTLQCSTQGTCACMYGFGQCSTGSNDVELIKLVQLFSQMTLCCFVEPKVGLNAALHDLTNT